WVLFRAESEQNAWQVLSKLAEAPAALLNFSAAQLTILQIRDPIIFPAIILIVPACMIAHLAVNWLNNKKFYLSPPWPVQVAVMVAMLCVLTIFSPDTSPKFIYFQF
ncbi:MAG: hypothetical protein K2X81_05900, partial [Candidatus Obscuribacterales bacterium]|nr:hypothetical protein [Candidatus Obscuribacterales bacterium]